MAVLDSVPGIKATVCVENQALQEYDDDEFERVPGEVGEHQAARTAAKYIESKTGKEFAIRLEVDKTKYKFDSSKLSFTTYIDGVKVNAKLVSGNRTIDVEGASSFSKDRRSILKPFKFSPIATSADDSNLASIKEDARRLHDVGEIMIKVHRTSEGRRRTRKLNSFKEFVVDESMSVHEKALKGQATSHGTVLGAPRGIATYEHWSTDYLDGKDYPIAIYRFKYRSEESLKSLLIMKRTPEPSPFPTLSPTPSCVLCGASGSFNLENLNADQKSQLQEFLGNLMGNETHPNGERKVKREREEDGTAIQMKKRSRNGPRVEIDLTGDDLE